MQKNTLNKANFLPFSFVFIIISNINLKERLIMNDREKLEKNDKDIMYLQNYISKQRIKITKLEKDDKIALEEKIESLENLKRRAEKIPLLRSQGVNKAIVSTCAAIVATIFSGIVILLNPSNLLIILMILNILLVNFNVFHCLKELNVLDDMIRNLNINQIDNSIKAYQILLEEVNTNIKKIEQEIEKNKKLVMDISLESRNIRISENQKASSEDELEKGYQITKKIK